MSLLDSAFFSAFFGAIAGASAAAWLAWWTAKRQRLREEILACNVAISICSSIVNAFVAIKKQSIQPLVERYEIEKGRLFLLSVIAATGGKGSFTLRFDLQNTQNVWVPTETLSHLVSTRIYSGSRPAIVHASLSQAVQNHRTYTELRNELVRSFRAMPLAARQLAYFGLEQAQGRDTSYPDAIDALLVYTDDVIYFADLLAALLNALGNSLACKLGQSAPVVNRLDFAVAAREGLLPDRASYSSFEMQLRPHRVEMVVEM